MKVYIIYSLKGGRFYVGQTKDIDRRIEEHNRRQVASTKAWIPWKLIWSIEVSDRGAAMRLERKLKNLSAKRKVRFIEKYSEGISSADEMQKILHLSACRYG
jgi:putative endonuclease